MVGGLIGVIVGSFSPLITEGITPANVIAHTVIALLGFGLIMWLLRRERTSYWQAYKDVWYQRHQAAWDRKADPRCGREENEDLDRHIEALYDEFDRMEWREGWSTRSVWH